MNELNLLQVREYRLDDQLSSKNPKFRSSRLELFSKKAFQKSFTKLARENQQWSSLFGKIVGQGQHLYSKRFYCKFFIVNYVKGSQAHLRL